MTISLVLINISISNRTFKWSDWTSYQIRLCKAIRWSAILYECLCVWISQLILKTSLFLSNFYDFLFDTLSRTPSYSIQDSIELGYGAKVSEQAICSDIIDKLESYRFFISPIFKSNLAVWSMSRPWPMPTKARPLLMTIAQNIRISNS